MELESIEKDNRLILDLQQNHSIANLIRKALWEAGAEAAYDKGHPLGDESKLIVEADDPEAALKEAVDIARGWMDDLEGQV